MTLQIEAAAISFLSVVTRLSLKNRVRTLVFWEGYLQDQTIHLRWSRCLTRMPHKHLLGEVFQTYREEVHEYYPGHTGEMMSQGCLTVCLFKLFYIGSNELL